jgi:predicted metalloprotease with PDZ domain
MPIFVAQSYSMFTLLLYMSQLLSTPSVTYQVNMEQPHLHYFQIEVEVAGMPGETSSWSLPVWTPGSYLVREFSGKIDRVSAKDEKGNPLEVLKTDKNTWTVAHEGEPFTLQYRVYAFEESVRTSFLDDSRAAIMPTSTLLYPDGFDIPVTVEFHPPFNSWKINSALAEKSGEWIRSASGKDDLYDSPTEIGTHKAIPFEAAGKPHILAMIGDGNYSIDSIITDLTKVIEAQTAVFGENPTGPYIFFVNNTEKRGGGLEHTNASCNQFPRDGYNGDGNKSFLALMSHEYFHIWNVKRLRPVALGPFNYDAENYTTSLWIAEGFTSYYDDNILFREGLYTEEEYLKILERSVNYVSNNPGDKVQSVAESSFDAWVKAYRRHENSGNVEVSYYSKGSMLAFWLDLTIITQSKGKYTLDDAMRTAWQELYLVNPEKGYTEAEFSAILERFAGMSLKEFYSSYVFGTATPDYKPLLEEIGVDVVEKEKSGKAWLGLEISPANQILSVREDGPAGKAGLNAFDQILAVNNIQLTGSFSAASDTMRIGETIEVTVLRRGLMRTFEVAPGENPDKRFDLIRIENPSEEQERLFKIWARRN